MPVPARLVAVFPQIVRKRARVYVSQGAVTILRLTATEADAIVQGVTRYRAHADLTEIEAPTFECTCVAFERWGPCEHIWALLIEADRQGLPALQSAPEAAAAQAARRGEDWEGRVDSLRADLLDARRGGHAPSLSDVRPDVEVLYVIDTRTSQRTGKLALGAYGRRQLKSGRWGTMRAMSACERDGLYARPAEDRRIIGALRGAAHAAGADRPADDDFLLDRAACDLLLPLLCATGRLHLRSPGDESRPALRWDASPWVLRLRLNREPEEDRLMLDAVLARDDREIAPADAQLVIAEGFAIVDGVVSPLSAGGHAPWLSWLVAEGPLVAPLEDEELVLARVLALPGLPEIDAPDAALAHDIVPVPLLEIREGGAGAAPVACRLTFRYGDVEIGADDSASVIGDTENERRIVRSPAAEAEALSLLLTRPGVRAADDGKPGEATCAPPAIRPLAVTLLAAGWGVTVAGNLQRSAGGMRAAIASGIDWFDLSGGLAFDDQVASLPAVLKAIRAGGTTVLLPDGSEGVLPEDLRRGLSLLAAMARAEDDSLRVDKHQGWVLDALVASREGVTVDRDFAAFRERLRSFSGIEAAHEPATFHGELRQYQREGLAWFGFLRDFACGGCLADDMGLGKTVQVLALLEERRLLPGTRPPSLVVAPRSVVFNWIDEAARFTPELRVLDYTGPRRRAHLPNFDDYHMIVTTYGVLRRDIEMLAPRDFDYAILDESQAVKNHASQSARASRLLRASHRLALSGTPLENHLNELWSLFEFLNPGMLGRSTAFRRLTRKSDTQAVDVEGRRVLARALRPFLLRRTKEQVAKDLPPKTEQTLHCEMPAKQRKLYRELLGHYRSSLLGRGAAAALTGSRMHVLEALLRLRQAACHPGLLDVTRREEDSAKLDALLPLLEEVIDEGHKALVFSQFTSLLAIVRERLDKDGLTYEYLDGQTRDRRARVHRFQEDEDCGVFLISLKAGGLGLNLTAADYVFILDPWWNPAAEAQAIDRSYRIGQTRHVMAYRLIVGGTVEEKILELQERKRNLADAILTSDNAVLRDLSTQDLELLLS